MYVLRGRGKRKSKRNEVLVMFKKKRVKRYFNRLWNSERNPNKRITPVGLTSEELKTWLKIFNADCETYEDYCYSETARKFKISKPKVKEIINE